MQNNTKTIGVQRGLKKNGTDKNTTTATHPLYNASHKHLKYLSMANDLQKELQVSHPLLGQRDKSVKRVKSWRTSTQSTLHRDNVHNSASQNESACERETVKKWEEKTRLDKTLHQCYEQTHTAKECSECMWHTDITPPLYTIIIIFLTLSSTVCFCASLCACGRKRGFLGVCGRGWAKDMHQLIRLVWSSRWG